MKIQRVLIMTVLMISILTLSTPLANMNSLTTRSLRCANRPYPKSITGMAQAPAGVIPESAAHNALSDVAGAKDIERKVSPEFNKRLAMKHSREVADKRFESAKFIKTQNRRKRSKTGSDSRIMPRAAGQPDILDSSSALSVAVFTAIGGRDNQVSEVSLLGDWDGREDCTADHGAKVDDFSLIEPDVDFTITRTAISEHTVANGFNENVYYYGDSISNFYVGTDKEPGVGTGPFGSVDILVDINIRELVKTGVSNGVVLLNPLPDDCADEAAVTGIAVNPVADLADFGMCGVIGEVVYVSIVDTTSCSFNPMLMPIRTRILAFGFKDMDVGEEPVGVEAVGARQILRNSLSNTAGVAVDDDGSLYFQLSDAVVKSGAAIFKATELPRTICGTLGRINRVIPEIPNGLVSPGASTFDLATATPIVAGGVRLTRYSGTSTFFGNIVALDAASCNVLYAAVARSLVETDPEEVRRTQGRFPAPIDFGPAGTPSMIISFADCSGPMSFDTCSAPAASFPGAIPVADGFADVAPMAPPPIPPPEVRPGVNNFRIFVLGDGPPISGLSPTPLKLEMQIDYTEHAGIAVTEEGTVYVISGGTPGAIGQSPSAGLGEILCFEDMCPMDRRADFIDFRGDKPPDPPDNGGNIGDGDSDRYDHIFFQSPLDTITQTPAGLAGLAVGFLRYTNRRAPNPMGPGVTLGLTAGKLVQADDDTDGPIIFESFDPGHQVAGGDDANVPNLGDDSDTVVIPDARCDDGRPLVGGSPEVPGSRNGGFEFLFGGPAPDFTATCPDPVGEVTGPDTRFCVWNGLFLNSNGNITFGVGDVDSTPTVPEFRSGPPRIAPAWADLDPSGREISPSSFPVQALGFSNINSFRVRWINVPEFIELNNDGVNDAPLCGSSNTFAVTLYDDGTGSDENTTESFSLVSSIGNNLDDGAALFNRQEGPTDLRFMTVLGMLVGSPPREEGTGIFCFEYGRMDLLGTPDRPVIVGYSSGGRSPLNPPGLCESNLGELARIADTGPFRVIDGQISSIKAKFIGECTESEIFEVFNQGMDPSVGSGGEVTLAEPDFDLRCEGNEPSLCKPEKQVDPNRGRVCFLGLPCEPCCVGVCQAVVPASFATAPGTTGLVNSLCGLNLNVIGQGFCPNEKTTCCPGFITQTGVPLQRPCKTVMTFISILCDTNGDGIQEATISLTNVMPVNSNLITATLPPQPGFPGTAFPPACCGGVGSLIVTTSFSAGDNNIFGPFTRTTSCPIDLGTRAPVVFSVTPSTGNCAIRQDVLITGSCFIIDNATNVTSVFAAQRDNPNNVIQARSFAVLSPNVLDAFFDFNPTDAGKTFLIFVSGPNGTSRNLVSLPAGAPANCPPGNEQGVQVTLTCDGSRISPNEPPVVIGCSLDRDSSGASKLVITGSNFRSGATVKVGGVSPKTVRCKDLQAGTGTFNSLIVKGRFCKGLPGEIVVTNPGPDGGASGPFNFTGRCSSN